MNIFFEFAIQHWYLWLLLVIILFLLFYEETKSARQGISTVSPQEATTLMNREHAIVLDVRSTQLFREGHVIGALNIPAESIDERFDAIKQYRDKCVIIYCARGQQSTSVAINLKKHNFSKACVIEGGIAAWQSEGMPVVKGSVSLNPL